MLKFLLNSTLNTLPTADNLRRWGVTTDGICSLCGLTENLKHVLCGCSYSLNQGRYKWRHNKVLQTLFDTILREVEERKQRRQTHATAPYIAFVKAGQKPKRSKKRRPLVSSILDVGNWSISADLHSSPSSIQSEISKILPEINNKYIPDIFMHDECNKNAVIAELTCPWEDNITHAKDRKHQKYMPLAKLLKRKGYIVHFFTIEVGSRGYISTSLKSFLTSLGFPLSKTNKLRSQLSQISILCSYTIYLHRNSNIWTDYSVLNKIT